MEKDNGKSRNRHQYRERTTASVRKEDLTEEERIRERRRRRRALQRKRQRQRRMILIVMALAAVVIITAAVWNNWIIAQPFSKENRVFFGKRFPH